MNLKSLWVKYRVWILALVAALLIFPLFLTVPRACRLKGRELELAQIKGENKALQVEIKKKDLLYQSGREEAESKIAELMGALDSAALVIATHEAEDVLTAGRIGDLEEKLAGTADVLEQNKLLRQIVAEFKISDALLRGQIGQYQKEVFSLKGMYDAEHKLRLGAESLGQGYKEALEKSGRENQALLKVVSSLKAKNSLSLWGLKGETIVLIGVLVYGATKVL